MSNIIWHVLGCAGVSWKVFGIAVVGWIGTIFVVGSISALCTAFGIYSPNLQASKALTNIRTTVKDTTTKELKAVVKSCPVCLLRSDAGCGRQHRRCSKAAHVCECKSSKYVQQRCSGPLSVCLSIDQKLSLRLPLVITMRTSIDTTLDFCHRLCLQLSCCR